jgi:hypothetical protein
VNQATNVVRALIGAITPREHKLEAEGDRVQKARDDALRALERRRWLIDRVLKRVLHDVALEGQAVPDGELLGPFLRSAARDRLARVAIVDTQGEFATVSALDTSYDQAQADVERLTKEIASTESRAVTAAAVARQIESESPGLSASLDGAEVPICPVCEVPINHAMANGCKLSHKLPDLASLRERRGRAASGRGSARSPSP